MRSCLREQAIKWSYWIKYLYLHAQSRCTCTQCCAFLNTFFCAVSRTNEAVQSHCLFSRVWRGWINNFSSPPLNSYMKHNGRFCDHQNCHLATIFVKLWLLHILRLYKWRRATLLGSMTLTYEDCTKEGECPCPLSLLYFSHCTWWDVTRCLIIPNNSLHFNKNITFRHITL